MNDPLTFNYRLQTPIQLKKIKPLPPPQIRAHYSSSPKRRFHIILIERHFCHVFVAQCHLNTTQTALTGI